MASSYLTNIHTRTIITENMIFHNVYMSKYVQSKKKKTFQFSIKDFACKCDQIHSFLRIWSYLLTKSLMKNFIFMYWLSLKAWNRIRIFSHCLNNHKLNKSYRKYWFFQICSQMALIKINAIHDELPDLDCHLDYRD